MTFLQKLKIAIGKNLIATATGRWYPKYPPEAYFYGGMSFSQCAEDLASLNILMQLGHEGPVHYVDVGCFHPIKYSNTYFFYLRGGSGLVIDMNDCHRRDFFRLRPRDTFVTGLVSDSYEPMHVRQDGSPTDSILSSGPNGKSQAMQPQPLSSFLDRHWPENKTISLLDIDCEDHDINVLRSNNWDKYRPRLVVLEDFTKTDKSPTYKYMENSGYRFVARIRCAMFFVNNIL
jgi:hypothetical protein